jgi:hypothetical protein
MKAALTRDAVGYAAFPLLYTQADMDAAVLASASSTAVATFTQREIDNAVARARLLSSSSSGGANPHTSDDSDPLAYCWLHAHTGHWGVNTLKNGDVKTEPDQPSTPATLGASPASLMHLATSPLIRRSRPGRPNTSLSSLPRQRKCEA